MKLWLNAIFVSLIVTGANGCAFEEADPGDVVPDVEALTGPVAFTYVNSNNKAPLINDDRWLQGLRCWAMSMHSENGHNYWTCFHTTSNALLCSHSPAATSGVQSVYLSQCTNGSPWSCRMHVSYDGESASQKPPMGTMSWSPNTPNEIRSYAFDDGRFGSCSASTGQGVFQLWVP